MRKRKGESGYISDYHKLTDLDNYEYDSSKINTDKIKEVLIKNKIRIVETENEINKNKEL